MKSEESNRPPRREVYKHCEQLTEELFYALRFKFQGLLTPYSQEQKRRTYNQAILRLLWKINCGDLKAMGALMIFPDQHQKALDLEEQFMGLCDEYHRCFPPTAY